MNIDDWLASARAIVSPVSESDSDAVIRRLAAEPGPVDIRHRRTTRNALACAALASLVTSVASGMAVAASTREQNLTWIAPASPHSPYSILVANGR